MNAHEVQAVRAVLPDLIRTAIEDKHLRLRCRYCAAEANQVVEGTVVHREDCPLNILVAAVTS